MEEVNTTEPRSKNINKKYNARKLRISLKYRPGIWRFILGLKCKIREKNKLLNRTKIKLQKLLSPKCDVACQTEQEISNNVGAATGSTENKGWVERGTEKSIADQVKEVAENALNQTGMVYVDSVGMYYDYKTGYYYNSELGLYYHTDTNCYYYYSDEKKEFVFHSYPDTSKMPTASQELLKHVKKKAKKHKQEQEDARKSPKKKKKRTVKNKHKSSDDEDKNEILSLTEKEQPIEDLVVKSSSPDDKVPEDLEDGECSDTQSDGSQASDSEDNSTASDDDAVAAHHPPCMRVLVRETTLPRLKVGSLFVVTKEGGSVGREGAHHAILLPETNVSRNHLEIRYDAARRAYTARDVGSKNGSVLNGRRMSASQVPSEHIEIPHGSTLVLGETKLLCHIHPGLDTCGHCEPGLLMEADDKAKQTAYTRTCSVQRQHQLELARLKNKYAPEPLAIEEGAYNDRARARREQVGSSHDAEKTRQSDLDTAIASDNKGFQMMQKMGWGGAGLGREGQGATEPVPLVSNESKAGLGAAGSAAPVTVGAVGSMPMKLRQKTLRPPARVFRDPLEEDDE